MSIKIYSPFVEEKARLKTIASIALWCLMLVFPWLIPGCSDNEATPEEPNTGPATFLTTFGGGLEEKGYEVKKTSDHGFVIVGYTTSFGSGTENVYVAKCDRYGHEQWSKAFPSDYREEGFSIQEIVGGGFIIGGWNEDPRGWGYNNGLLMKIDGNGNELWSKEYAGYQYGRDRINSVIQTRSGDFLGCGTTYSLGDSRGDLYLVKTDGLGNLLWESPYSSTGVYSDDLGEAVRECADGHFIMAGSFITNGDFKSKACLVRVDENGLELWRHTYGFDNTTVSGHDVQQTADGGFISCGELDASPSSYVPDIIVFKTDTQGEVEWYRRYSEDEYKVANAVQQTADGGYIVCGVSTDIHDEDIFLLRLDSAGNELWWRFFGTFFRDAGLDVQIDEDGGFIITGYTKSYGAGYYDMILIKTDPEGNVEDGSSR